MVSSYIAMGMKFLDGAARNTINHRTCNRSMRLKMKLLTIIMFTTIFLLSFTDFLLLLFIEKLNISHEY